MTTTYLARYQNGEREAVWAELLALGGAIREEPLLTDARAVARETMARARRNLGTLVERLRSLDYQFVYPDEVLVPPDPETLALLDRLEREAGPLPLALRAFYETVGSVCLMGSHPKLSGYAKSVDTQELFASTMAAYTRHMGPPPPPDPATMPPLPPQFAGLMTPELERLRQQTAQIMGLLNQVVRQNTTEASRLREEGGPPAERLQQMRGLAEELQANMQRSATGRTEGQGPTSDPLVIWTPPDDDLDAFR